MATEQERKILMNRIGRWIADEFRKSGLSEFTGNVRFNFREGTYGGVNTEQTYIPERENARV